MGFDDTVVFRKRAPTLYAIIIIKLVKGLLLVAAAFVAYKLSDNLLPEEFRKVLTFLHLDPGARFFQRVAAKLATVTEREALVFAAGTLIYSSFSLIEGVGLIFRVSWAGWMVVGESVFFIPIEINSLLKEYSWTVFGILLFNIFIAWYIFQNRHRLFRHHHHPPPAADDDVLSAPDI